MGVLGRLVEEDVLHDDAFHLRQRFGHVLGVGVGLDDVFALAVQGLEFAIEGGFEHVGDAQARLGVQRHAPGALEQAARGGVGDVAVAGQLVREAAHVAAALHVVLAAQRVHAHAFAADHAASHGQVGDAHDHGRALRVLGHAQAVVNGRVRALRIQAGGGAQLGRGHAGFGLEGLGRVLGAGHELAPLLEALVVTALGHVVLGHQAFGDHDVGHGRDDGHVRAGLERQVVLRLHVGRGHQVDLARVDDDELGARPAGLAAQALLHARGEHGVGVRGVGADDHDDVGVLDRLEGLRAGRGAEGLAQAVAGGRVADAGAGVHVVGAKGRAHQLLHEVGLFVGAARGGDAAHRVTAVLGLDALDLGGRVRERHLPADFLPGLVDAGPDHGRGDAVLVGRIAPGEAALDAAVAFVGLAVFPGRHAHHGVALHLGLEAAAHAAVGAGGDDAVLGLAVEGDRFFLQRGRRAGLDAGAAGDALAVHEGLVLAGRHAALEATARNRQRERALGFLAGAHAAVADDALAGVVREIGVGLVLLGMAMVLAADAGHVLARGAVAHIAQAGHASHVLQFAVAVGAAGQAVQRVVGDVELHHALADVLQLGRLRVHDHAGLGGRGARGRVALAALHLDQAQATGAKGLQAVGGAELGHAHAGIDRGPHQRGALGHFHLLAVDGERHPFGGGAGRGAEVDVLLEVVEHGVLRCGVASVATWMRDGVQAVAMPGLAGAAPAWGAAWVAAGASSSPKSAG